MSARLLGLAAAGGALGAVLRHALALTFVGAGFPWGTLLANALGSFLLARGAACWRESPAAWAFWATGVCGGFTTFSLFSLEALRFLQAGRPSAAAAYAALTLVLSLGGAWVGASCLTRERTMKEQNGTRRSRAWRWLFSLYAVLAVPGFLWTAEAALDAVFAGTEAQLLVLSRQPVLELQVIYAGREYRPRPDLTRSRLGAPWLLVPGLIARHEGEPRLSVSWRTAVGSGKTEAVMTKGSDPSCLFLLEIDADGRAVAASGSALEAPFSIACASR